MSQETGASPVASQDRPFRHLCSEAELRDRMDDGEFWAHVFQITEFDEDYFDHAPALGPLTEPCGDCGAVGACAWDAEGRPLIHPQDGDDDA